MEKPDTKYQQGFTLLEILLITTFSLVISTGIFITLSEKQTNPFSLFQNLPQPTPSPQPTFPPQPTLTPVKTRAANLNEQFTVKAGDAVELTDTGLILKITVIALPSAGTYDLPNKVEGQVFYGGQKEQFNLIVGGNQPFELQEQRRQKKVFDTFVIYAKKVAVDEATLIVTK